MRLTAMRQLLLIAAIVAGACTRSDAPVRASRDTHLAAADAFTDRYHASALRTWRMRARAAGADCSILVVETPMLLDDTIVEAMHYGTGSYAVDDGGIERFSRERAFRGVVYRDKTHRVWTFGNVTRIEVAGVQTCR